jgi:F420-dependent oxidoreductase-like protein
MRSFPIGVAIHERNAASMVSAIRYAESVGIATVWLTTGAGPDALTVIAAASSVTQRIRLGTAIVPTYPRHPLVMAQQSADINSIAPGRFILGLGPSHSSTIEGRYGLSYVRPLEHLREYVTIVRHALSGEQVDFDGKHFNVHAKLFYGADITIIISALRAGSFALAAEIADGAVTWICPARYLRDVALPAMDVGARKAGRPRTKLIAHAFVCLTEDEDTLSGAVNEYLVHYPRLTNYQEMFVAAGMPEARQGAWSANMIDAVLLHGDEAACERKIAEFISVSGCAELILSIVPTGADRVASLYRTLDWVGSIGGSFAQFE